MDEIQVLRDAYPVKSFDSDRARDAARKELLAVMAVERKGAPRRDRRRQSFGLRRRGLVAALGMVVVSLAVAVPAFGLPGQIIDFFSAPVAPSPAQEGFTSLDVGAPAGMAPGVSGPARSVMTATVDGSDVNLWVAPTSSGGFCLYLESSGGGCDRDRSLAIDPSLAAHTAAGPLVLFGDVLSPSADHLQVTWANGDSASIPLQAVSDPVDASFFVYQVPASDQASADWPATLGVVDASGTTVATSGVEGLLMRQR
ncbi:MAG: hypothetical protein ACRDLM_10115 [Gaiellaceae bacterium]